MISDAQRAAIVAHAEHECPRECGGVLTDVDAVRCENIARDKMRQVEIGQFELTRIARHNKVIGFYHSHVDFPAMPSATDFARALHFGMLYVIASVSTRNGGRVTDVCTFRLVGGHINKQFEQIVLRDGKVHVVQIVRQHA